MRRMVLTVPWAALAIVLGMVAPAGAASPTSSTKVIVLPGATSAEAITAGPGDTFYAADMLRGTIYRGDIHAGTAQVFIEPPAGTQTVGMDLDVRDGLLFVAGGPAKGYVYNIHTRALVASYDLGDPNVSFINDVTVTPYGAWFDDSTEPRLYFVPIVFGIPGPVRTLNLSGPAAGPPGTFTINDIASTPSGDTLLVAPTFLGKLMTIDPVTGASKIVAGVDVPNADGILLHGRELWVTRIDNHISRFHLNADLTSGTLEKVITNPLFHVPLTSVRFGDRLAVVNSHLDTGLPPTSPTYEVLVIHD
jgi:sugar lactone lactonase YvrE